MGELSHLTQELPLKIKMATNHTTSDVNRGLIDKYPLLAQRFRYINAKTVSIILRCWCMIIYIALITSLAVIFLPDITDVPITCIALITDAVYPHIQHNRHADHCHFSDIHIVMHITDVV